MQEVIKECNAHDLSYIVLGKGSNSLFDDRGFKGVVILNKIDFFSSNPEGLFHVGAGYSFSLLGVQTARQGFSGLEFACGIPATVGGAVYMNAGANQSETKDSLVSVDYVDEEGNLHSYNKENLLFSYRMSPFQKRKGAIVGAAFQLTPCKEARKKQLEIIHYRQQTQPYGDKSAGCVFRNPEGYSAGKLIQDSGLKNFSIGGAQVSTLHANFLINAEKSSSEDFKKLMDHVHHVVKDKYGIELEREIKVIPYEF